MVCFRVRQATWQRVTNVMRQQCHRVYERRWVCAHACAMSKHQLKCVHSIAKSRTNPGCQGQARWCLIAGHPLMSGFCKASLDGFCARLSLATPPPRHGGWPSPARPSRMKFQPRPRFEALAVRGGRIFRSKRCFC